MTQSTSPPKSPFWITLGMFLCLQVRKCYPLLLVVRQLYRRIPSPWFRRAVVGFFDPNSIRRHSHFAIASKYVYVRGSMGETLRVDLGDHIGWDMFLKGYFDLVPSLVAFVVVRERPDAVYVDVGANIGDTSVGLAHRGINTVGIDASPMAIAELCHNVMLNSPIPYTVVHAAVAPASQPFSGNIAKDYLHINVPMGNTGAASVHDSWNETKDTNVTMCALPRTVTEIVGSLSMKSVGCIKIDVEGAEDVALRGMQDLLTQQRCPVVFEYRIDHIEEIGMAQESLLDLFPEGYRFFAVDADLSSKSGESSRAVLRVRAFDPKQSYENVLGVFEQLPPSLVDAEADSGLVVDLT